MTKTVILTIGIPGCGKSTFAAEYVKRGGGDAIFLNGDNVRAELYGDASIQGDPKEVFGLIKTRMLEGLKNPSVKYLVIDNTNLSTKIRNQYYEMVSKDDDVEFILVYFPVNLEKALRQNKMRDRFVPESVINRMAGTLTPPTTFERNNYRVIEVE